MKKMLAVTAAASMLFAAFPAMAEEDITVMVNGSKVDFSAYDNVLPYIENERTLIPIRATAESLGLDVEWDGEARTVTVSGGDTRILLTIDSDKAYVNDEEITLDVPARITDERTFVPLRFVSESMGAVVDWDDAARTVTITKEGVNKVLALIDNTKWQLNADDNVFWQTGISYCAAQRYARGDVDIHRTLEVSNKLY